MRYRAVPMAHGCRLTNAEKLEDVAIVHQLDVRDHAFTNDCMVVNYLRRVASMEMTKLSHCVCAANLSTFGPASVREANGPCPVVLHLEQNFIAGFEYPRIGRFDHCQTELRRRFVVESYPPIRGSRYLFVREGRVSSRRNALM